MEGIFVRNNQDRSFVPMYFKAGGFWYKYCGRKNTAHGSVVLPIFEHLGPKCLVQW